MRYSIAALGLSAIITVGACSDDGPETSTLSKPEFVEQADAICADFAAELAARAEPSNASTGAGDNDSSATTNSTTTTSTKDAASSDGDAPTVSVREDVIDLANSYQQVVEDIRAIGFPEEEADVLDGLFSQLEDTIEELASKAEEIDPDAGPDGLISVSSTVQKLTEALNALRVYGFDRCTIA